MHGRAFLLCAFAPLRETFPAIGTVVVFFGFRISGFGFPSWLDVLFPHPMRHFKDHWPHLLVSFTGSALSTAFALGFAWATLGNRVTNAERRLEEIERANVSQTRWQVGQNTADITAIRADARQTESAVAQINARLGGIDAKLDAIAEAVKRK